MKIGTDLIEFELRGTDEKLYSTRDFKNKAVCLIFTCNHCPYAVANVSRIKDLYQRYGDSVQFLSICSNDAIRYPQDSFENMKAMAKELGLHPYYLHDESQEVARSYNAQRTPEVYLFDHEHHLVYHGAIDDSCTEIERVTEKYLENAIKEVLDNQRVKHAETEAVGCSIKWK